MDVEGLSFENLKVGDTNIPDAYYKDSRTISKITTVGPVFTRKARTGKKCKQYLYRLHLFMKWLILNTKQTSILF